MKIFDVVFSGLVIQWFYAACKYAVSEALGYKRGVRPGRAQRVPEGRCAVAEREALSNCLAGRARRRHRYFVNRHAKYLFSPADADQQTFAGVVYGPRRVPIRTAKRLFEIESRWMFSVIGVSD